MMVGQVGYLPVSEWKVSQVLARAAMLNREVNLIIAEIA